MKKILKSIGALVAGFITVAVLSIVTDVLLEKLGIFPPQQQASLYVWWMLALALMYRTIFTIIGGFITAKLAPNSGLKHAVVLGLIGMLFATIGAIANWDKGNQWYPVLLILVSVPSTWFGGKLQMKK